MIQSNSQNPAYSPLRVLSVFSLVMITVTSVDSLRNLPTTALLGSQLIIYFIFAAITFLIPTALVSAELATALPRQGGVYVWVKEAFGKKVGFLAIWFQWVENVIWYPTIISFIAGTLAYLINPALVDNKFYIVAVVLAVFWGATLLNMFGMRISAGFSAICGIFGLIIPMIVIIVLGLIWMLQGNVPQIDFSWQALTPNLHSGILVALTGVMLSFCGMEITTVYAQEVKNPQHDYPKALLIATIILLSTLMFGSLAIAVVIPKAQINLVGGLMQAYENFFHAYHMQWLVPVIAVMILLGGAGGLSNWIIAPSKGLLIAAHDGNLPHWFAKENKHGAPTRLLIFQGIITTIITMFFLFLPGINGAFMLLTALAAQLYMVMYILMFVTGIKLRYTAADLPRSFKIPGGNWGMITVAVVGIISCVLTLVVGFIPPDDIYVGNHTFYILLLASSFVLMCVLPFFIRKRSTRENVGLSMPLGAEPATE